MRPGDPSALIASDGGARPASPADLPRARQVLEQVTDPEIPVLSVVDLGIVRDLAWVDGHLQVTVTPTYSGCPASELIEQEIRAALERAGFRAPRLLRRLAPAWSSDWISARGRERLRAYGIAPPTDANAPVCCPRCGSADTERLSEFGSTACKALYRCRACREPFDQFKCI